MGASVYRVTADTESSDDHLRLSFRDVSGWQLPDELMQASRAATSPLRPAAILLGDDERGPALHCFVLPPDVYVPDAVAHGHSSDTWRISLRGHLPMGRDSYGPGEFRFQQGWKPYASDNYAMGPDGGWCVVMFGDRRGMRVRPVKPTGVEPPLNKLLAAWLKVDGDLVSNDPSDTCGTSALTTTLPGFRGGHVNGSFSQTEDWVDIGDGSRVAVGLMGDPEIGPLVVLSVTPNDSQALPPMCVDTETLHLVVTGSCTFGEDKYQAGDMRLQLPGVEAPAARRGADQLAIVTIFGDRRAPLRSLQDCDDAWSRAVIKAATHPPH